MSLLVVTCTDTKTRVRAISTVGPNKTRFQNSTSCQYSAKHLKRVYCRSLSPDMDGSSAAEYSKRWEILWNGGNEEFDVKNGDGGILKPGQAFDAGRSAPHLIHLLESGALPDLKEKTVLVPGCGRGYDVISFSQVCHSVTGVELAPTAVQAAHELLKKGDHQNARVISGDFFAPEAGTQYDIGYDYTFFCAIHPNMRDDWARAWAAHLRQPGGILITSIFPVLPLDSRDQQGPPWPVWPELYASVLEKHGFALDSLEKVPDQGSHPGREGKEYLAIWKLS